MSYDRQALLPEILHRLSEGEPLAQICRDLHMPHRSVVYDWMDAEEELTRRIAQARAKGFDAIAEQCLVIADTPMEGVEVTSDADGVTEKRGDMLGHRKLQIETRLKLLAKWDPKRYGDMQKIEHSGAVDIAAGLIAARKRSGIV